MSALQDNLNTIKETADELAELINQIAKTNGSEYEISECTSFADYPEILRKAISATSGIVTVFAYRISDVDPGIPETDGSFDFISNSYTAPENWSKSDDLDITDADTVWMSQAIFASNSEAESKIMGSWSKPVKIASPHPKGISEFMQTVYLRSSSEIAPQKPIGNGDITLIEESQAIGWSKINLGISKDYPYIWTAIRTREDDGWTTYSTPVLYAYYSQDGKDGESAKLTRTAFAFTATSSREDKPATPKGGYWNITTNALTLPVGWTESPNTTDDKKYSWLSTATFSSDKPDSPQWTEPSCVTGEDGVDGTDGTNSEFVYALLPTADDYTLFVSTMNTEGYSLEISETDVVPNFILNGELVGTSIKINRGDDTSFTVQLTDSPVGIDDTSYKIEIYWTRAKTSSGAWGNWVGPMYWSMWGENGMDGDGIEYIFTASNDETCDILPPVYADLVINNPAEAEKFQQNEYVPDGWFDDDDDWKGLDAEVPFLFCSSRKQYTTEDGKKMWGEFSTPKIWGHYGKDGNGAYTSFAFCISKEDLSQYKVTGGYYGDSLKNLLTEDAEGNEIEVTWHDTLNSTPKFDETIWMINKFFNGSANETEREWAGPTKMADSEHFQVEFNCPVEGDSKSYYNGNGLISLQAFKEMSEAEYVSHEELETAWRTYVYNNGGGAWNDGGSGAVYMATARCVNNIWEEWSINKIQGEAGDTTQFIFILTDGAMPASPTPADLSGEYQKDDFKPEGWSFEPKTVSETMPVCWVSQRLRKSGVWEAYSDPTAWSMYAKGNVHLEIEQDVIGIPVESDGSVDQDYNDFIINKLFLYDNGKLATNGVWTALINDDNDDFTIDSVLTSIPTDPSTAGFFGATLYIGREFLNRYINDSKLTVECRVEYNGVPYAKSFTINKSTNIYELELSKNVLTLDAFGAFKDSVLEVTPVKWVEDTFSPVKKGYIEYILTPESGNPMKAGYVVNDETAEINLMGYTNIQSIQINYKESESSEVLTYEHIGTIRDGKDALNKFKSTIFCRTNADIGSEQYRPKGGTYDNPFPTSGYTVPDKLSNGSLSTDTENVWSDGVPPYDEADPKQIWSSTKWFVSDNSQEDEWSIPVLIQDTNDVDVWWSDSDVPTPGNPDEPSLGAIWYDGDDIHGNNITHSPIWMAMRRQLNGSWTPWVVSKVKGEKGDKGDKGDKGEPGAPGVNGGFGPMARYGVWAIGNEYYSRDDDEMWYDIVEYRGSYYLCKAKHRSSADLTPDSATSYWTKAAQFEFVTIDTAAIANLIAKNIEVTKLRTNGGNAQIQIEAGEMKVYASQSDTHPDISFGVDDDGFALIKFYDKDGKLVYSIGPNGGYKEYTKSTVKDWKNHTGLVRVADTFEYADTKESIPNLITSTLRYKDRYTASVTVYERVDLVDNVPQTYHGKYFSTNSATDTNLVTGLYCNASTYIGSALSEFKDQEETLNEIKAFNEKYSSCAINLDTSNNYYIHKADLVYFVSGDRVYEESVFFQTNWSNPRQ